MSLALFFSSSCAFWCVDAEKAYGCGADSGGVPDVRLSAGEDSGDDSDLDERCRSFLRRIFLCYGA